MDPASYRLHISGLVDFPRELTLEELRRRPRSTHTAGFECSGNSNRRINPLVGNARWAGVSLSSLLKEAGIKSYAREVVFWGADKGTEEVSHGGNTTTVEQPFGRSLALADAMKSEVLVAYQMNGEPLSPEQGAPARLIVPGWYGVAKRQVADPHPRAGPPLHGKVHGPRVCHPARSARRGGRRLERNLGQPHSPEVHGGPGHPQRLPLQDPGVRAERRHAPEGR